MSVATDTADYRGQTLFKWLSYRQMNLVTFPMPPARPARAAHLPVRDLLESLGDLLPPDVSIALAWRDPDGVVDSESMGPRETEALRCVLAAMEEQPGGGDCSLLRIGGQTPAMLAACPAAATSELPPRIRALVVSTVQATLEKLSAEARITALSESHRLQRALFRISELSQSSLDLHLMLQGIHREVAGLMFADNFLITLWDRDDDTVTMPYFVDQIDDYAPTDESLPIDSQHNSLTIQMMLRGEPMMGPFRDLCEACGISDEHIMGPVSHMWIGVPMKRNGEVCGAVVVQSYDRTSPYTEESLDLLNYVAQHIQIALDRRSAKTQLEEAVDHRTSELREANWALQLEIEERERVEMLQNALFRISELSASVADTGEFFAQVHGILGRLIDCRNFYIALVSEDDPGYLDFVFCVDEHDTSIPQRWPRGRGMSDYVLDSGRPLLTDAEGVKRLEQQGEIIHRGLMTASWLGVPLVRDGTSIGLMVAQSYHDEVRFSLQDMELMSFAARQVVSSLERRSLLRELEGRVRDRTQELAQTNRTLLAEIGERIRAEQRLQYQANHDGLTGLPNRQQLLERLQLNIVSMGAGGTGPAFAVLYLDLDQFKLVNDSMGHAAGDEMLVEVANRIRGELGPNDMVARLGGDEFAVLAEMVGGIAEVESLAQRIIRAFDKPLYVHDRELFPSASIGIALWQPGYSSGEELLRDADAAMYRAKAMGRSQAMVFDEAMRAESLRLLNLEADLRRAINSDSFEVQLQPIVHLGNGRVAGHEALVRWRHESGLLSPAAFIGVGEDSGLIREVDWLVYRRVTAWLASTKVRGYVSVNVSPLHFRSPEFAARLLGMLDDAGADPARLRIEVTEASLMEDIGRTLDLLMQLKARGVMAMLDDFGTGFSALSYLRRFPFHALKIDRTFVAGLQDATREGSEALVKAIIALADGLGIDCIAEGVETVMQRDYLREEGCTYGQGFLFSAPRNMADINARRG